MAKFDKRLAEVAGHNGTDTVTDRAAYERLDFIMRFITFSSWTSIIPGILPVFLLVLYQPYREHSHSNNNF